MNLFGVFYSSHRKTESETETTITADNAVYYYNFKKEKSNDEQNKQLPKLAKAKCERPDGLSKKPRH